MCYLVYVSTTSAEDLNALSNALLRLEKPKPDDQIPDVLKYEHMWFVTDCHASCSCGFRHLMEPSLGFDIPQDWAPEEEDSVEATRAFIGLVRRLVQSGHRVDCVDFWSGRQGEKIRYKEVNLKAVRDDAFRFFENYRFEFLTYS